jgi:SAM-dependent methyltransferase
METLVYRHDGWCPIDRAPATFSSATTWYRDHLKCSGCAPMGGSLPRERAAAWVMSLFFPHWADQQVHEIAPTGSAFTQRLTRDCRRFTSSHFFPDRELGAAVGHLVNEDAENLTMADASLDLVVSLDVFEHLNRPDRAMQEIVRVLRPGGAHVWTAPTYAGRLTSTRRAERLADGSLEHFAPPEYHGDPISDQGSLVFFEYGYDLPDLVKQWCGRDTTVLRFVREDLGVIGEFTEVYVTWA